MSRFCILLLMLLAAPAPRLAGQSAFAAGDGWDAPRALELIRRAQQQRAEAHGDTALVSYRADARAFVYFYLDRRDTGERNLVKTDQIALDVMWRAPDLTKQVIVGWRDAKSLPTNIRYHIDHLAVVMENFGDEIRIGDGDEVRDVPHPAAPAAERFYQYRLTDSLTLRLPGTPEPVRVYELQVRPRDLGQPAIIGSVFVEQRRGDLVRLDFTFTPASYVDRNLDHISISLDNGLWLDRFWLPNEQRVEIRRQIPELDIPAGSVIRGTMRVGNYRFNEPIPIHAFGGLPVVVAPREQREAFPFEQELFAELRAEGLGPTVELGEIRRQAMRLARGQALSGLPRARLRVPNASALLRYNRSEGAALGAGVRFAPHPLFSGAVYGGWAFGAEHPLLELALDAPDARVRPELRGYLNQPRELGGEPVASGVINTVSAFVAGADYSDLHFATGGSVGLAWHASPRLQLRAALRLEDQRSARLESDFSVFGNTFRPVAPIDDGWLGAAALALRRTAPYGVARGWDAELQLDAGRYDFAAAEAPAAARPDDAFVRAAFDARLTQRWDRRGAEAELRLRAGTGSRGRAVQQRFPLGGRGTVPGFAFRSLSAEHVLIGNLAAGLDLAEPWARLRLLAAAGAAGSYAEGWPPVAQLSPGTAWRVGLGAGLGVLHDILRVDLHRGLGAGGRWELIVEARHGFWDFL